MHPILAVKTRYKYFCLKHFSYTSSSRRLKKFKNRYLGARCFFVGNGPSLSVDDLNKLKANGDVTFGFNRIYNIFDKTEWRPDYYISQDYKMLAGCNEVVSSLSLPVKLIPADIELEYGIKVECTHPFKMIWTPSDQLQPSGFSTDISNCVYWGSTCMYTAAQIAVYMGFKKIYFLGVDHRFHISQKDDGQIIIDNNAKDYFSDKYNEDKDNLYIPNIERSTRTYMLMKKHCDALGVSVYNATRGGMLEVFPRVDFDTLF